MPFQSVNYVQSFAKDFHLKAVEHQNSKLHLNPIFFRILSLFLNRKKNFSQNLDIWTYIYEFVCYLSVEFPFKFQKFSFLVSWKSRFASHSKNSWLQNLFECPQNVFCFQIVGYSTDYEKFLSFVWCFYRNQYQKSQILQNLCFVEVARRDEIERGKSWMHLPVQHFVGSIYCGRLWTKLYCLLNMWLMCWLRLSQRCVWSLCELLGSGDARLLFCRLLVHT